MKANKERVRLEVSNYDPASGDGSSVSYFFRVDDTEKILDFLKVNIDAGMYVLIHPWWQEEEE